MADALLETVASNPYDGIVADTSTQISNIDAQIQQVTSAISKLEQVSPTSPTLSQLKERLASLQSQKEWLTTTNESARTLSDSFTKSSANLNTLKWIYDVKQQELERAKAQDDAAYRKMYEDTQRQTNNYINALWNATSSENAIINANAWRQWASAQSTAEARARNYLANAQAQNEAANTARQQLNAIEEWRINSWQWYIQLSQNNADNYLRQQVLNDYQAAEAEKDRQLQRDLNWVKSSWWWGSSSWWSKNSWWWTSWWGWKWNWWNWSDIIDPYEEFSNNNETEDNQEEYDAALKAELNKVAFEEQQKKKHADDLYYWQDMFTHSSIWAWWVAPFWNTSTWLPKTREQLLQEEQEAIAKAQKEAEKKKKNNSQAYWWYNNNMVH